MWRGRGRAQSFANYLRYARQEKKSWSVERTRTGETANEHGTSNQSKEMEPRSGSRKRRLMEGEKIFQLEEKNVR